MKGQLVQDKGEKKAHSPSLSKSTINNSGKKKDSERKAKISSKGFYVLLGPASLLWFKERRNEENLKRYKYSNIYFDFKIKLDLAFNNVKPKDWYLVFD